MALDYLKTVLASAEEPWQVKTRRHRPPPLPVGAPDDQQIFLFSSTQTFRLEKKVDKLFPKLAELSALLASGELVEHSPAGWIYNGIILIRILKKGESNQQLSCDQ